LTHIQSHTASDIFKRHSQTGLGVTKKEPKKLLLRFAPVWHRQRHIKKSKFFLLLFVHKKEVLACFLPRRKNPVYAPSIFGGSIIIVGVLSSIVKNFSGQSKKPVSFADLAEYPPEDIIPRLDRRTLDETGLTPEQAAWRRDGVLRLDGFVPDEVTEPYIARRAAHPNPAGWLIATPYMHIPELRDLALYPPLMEMMHHLIGEEMLLHLCLSGWVSSQRGWHQDDYLNPPFVNSWYAAVWIALGDIHPDSGPFEYIRGSHKWPLLRGEKVRQHLTKEETERRAPDTGINHWERYAERFVSPAIDAEIAARKETITPFIAKRGDVLIWHGRLMHRGSLPNVPGMERRSLICHYSGVNHRQDMPRRARDQNGQSFALFENKLIG
jgi:hypothetical protein